MCQLCFFAHKIININSISDEYLGSSVTRDQLRLGFSLFSTTHYTKCAETSIVVTYSIHCVIFRLTVKKRYLFSFVRKKMKSHGAHIHPYVLSG